MPAPRPDGLLDRIVAPWPLLAGVAVGLVCCVAGGRAVSDVNLFRDFERFTCFSNWQTNYQPTVGQVRSLLRERFHDDRIAVIVTGNSTLVGSGQGRDDLLTRQLEQKLGDRYRVINLAVVGLNPPEFGPVAAEMLHRDGHRVIVVTTNWLIPAAPYGEPDGRPMMQPFFWEAHGRGFLSECPERDARLARPLAQRADAAGDERAREELRRRLAIDRGLHFRDLWNAFEYRCAATVWSPPLRKWWLRARVNFPDTDPRHPPASPPRPEVNAKASHAIVRAMVEWGEPAVRGPAGDLIPANRVAPQPALEASLRDCFPPEVRERLLLVASRLHPYVIGLLSPRERETFDALGPAMAITYGRVGVTVVEVGRGYSPLDYYDHVHLTAAGGRRMAADLAPHIRARAAKLGYLADAPP
jgi:hypothetical protein